MKGLKTLLKAFMVLAILSAALPVFAETPAAAKKEMSFEQKKEAALARLDKRISELQGLRGCISGARTKEDMKKCRETFKPDRGEKQDGCK